jgi:hypothetical protein
MAEITPIQKPFAPDEIPATLRTIADEIEAGKFGLRTTCVVVLGHTESRPQDSGDKLQTDDFEIFGCGPRCDIFTVRGLLLTAATQAPE